MSARSSGRKRKNDSQESPSKKRKLAEGLLGDPEGFATEFQQGQIVRIDLINWVTFDSTVIDCEPGLNLIVGPNGTGKSSIVCAICLGLGGKPRSLGRGEKASDFIKYGRNTATIKIELFNEDRNNDIIQRVITKTGSNWALNGKKVPSHQIDTFVKEKRNIKVDNLCQFLAQDRVSEFARLTPKELLIETEKAIEDDQLYKWHQFLIDEGEKASNSQNEIENLRQTLRQNQNEVATLHRTIEQFESRKAMEDEMKVLQALHEWNKAELKHKEYRIKLKHVKKLKKRYEKKKANISPLRKEQQKWQTKSSEMNRKHTKQQQDARKADRRRLAAHKRSSALADEIKLLEDRIKQAMQDQKTKQKQIKRVEHEIMRLETECRNFNLEEIEEAKQEKLRITRGGLKDARNERNRVEQELRRTIERKHNIEHNLNRIQQNLERLTNETRRKEEHIFSHKYLRHREFKAWVDTHKHEFHGQVYGPIVAEMTVRDQQHATYLNAVMSQGVFYGYVCTDGRDWQTLLREVSNRGLMITIYTSTEDDNNGNNRNSQRYIRRPVDHNTLHQYGVDGYLDEIFEAPEVIKRTLNDNLGLHQRAYCMREPETNHLNNILVTTSGQSGRLSSLLTPTSIYTIKASRYSTHVLRQMGELPRHRQPILTPTPDNSQEIHQNQQEKKKMHQQLDAIQAEKNELEHRKKMAVNEVNKLNEKKKELDAKIGSFNAVSNKLQKKKKDLEELEKDQDDNPNDIRDRLTKEIQKKNVERIMTFERLANDIQILHDMMKRCNSYQIAKKHYDAEANHVLSKIKVINQRNQDLKKQYEECRKQEHKLKTQYDHLVKQATHQYPRSEYVSKWKPEQRRLSQDEIMDKINHLHGRVNVLFIDPERVQRYHRLQKKIDQQTKKLTKLENEHTNKAEHIKEIENRWKPQLMEAVEKISSKFGEFFQQFNQAEGKVELVSNGENDSELKYSDWCIDILTKFRADQPWKRLTSSSQSGGEKSVSTMLYLLSLQEVTTVPFRVVDEINQGMDPINERRIMQILNFECTPKKEHRNNNDGSIKNLPQYFVVTPKLLPRLEYSPCSSVYVIFNGPFQMPQMYWQLNKFVQSQKVLSQSPPRNGKRRNRRDAMSEEEEDEEDDEDEDEE